MKTFKEVVKSLSSSGGRFVKGKVRCGNLYLYTVKNIIRNRNILKSLKPKLTSVLLTTNIAN